MSYDKQRFCCSTDRNGLKVRLASLQLLVVLYERSQHARSLVHKDLNDWIQLTVGVHNEKVPPPKKYADRVRRLMLNSLRNWHDQRGERHREVCYLTYVSSMIIHLTIRM
jgi:hypothetical protein